MDNRKKKNEQKRKQNPNTNTKTEVLNTEEEKYKSDNKTTGKKEDSEKKTEKTEQEKGKESGLQTESLPKENEVNENKETVQKEKVTKETPQKESTNESTDKKNANKQNKENPEKAKSRNDKRSADARSSTAIPLEQSKGIAVNAAKILLPVAACAIVIAVVISYIASRKSHAVDTQSLNIEDSAQGAVSSAALSEAPLAENANTDVNDLMRDFYTALADGDMNTVKGIRDYNTDREIITYEKKSEFIESYDNVNCYTKPGMDDNSYFVYVTYDVKIKDIETKAPGLNAFYVYTSEDGSLKIDGETEENIKAAFKLVTSQDDVVDLYNKIDVSYNEATTSDEALEQFMADLPGVIKESVGVALAQLEAQDAEQDSSQSAAENGEAASTESVASNETTEPLQNQVVNQIVRTTDTVNVRSSDSEEADKIGKAQAGTELKRIEEKINGWSKVIFEDKEAYIKSDYLEVVTTEVTEESQGTVVATTNVNVRSQASQESERLGSALAGTAYNLLEDQGEWYKIDYNGTTGYVKAEFFQR